nr:hypothetical protein CFP56_79125 [Quercus suber]
MDEQSGVTTIVDYEIGPTIGTPIESMLSAPPVLLEGLALLGEHGSRVTGDGDSGVVLGREDVVGTPTDLGSTKTSKLDEGRFEHREDRLGHGKRRFRQGHDKGRSRHDEASMAGVSSSIDRNPIVNLRSHLLSIQAEGDSWECFGE